MARPLVVWGTSGGAGKSWLATALCRVAARRGLVVEEHLDAPVAPPARTMTP